MPIPLIAAVGARLLGGAVARGVATRVGASAATTALSGRAGSFAGGVLSSYANNDRAEREAAEEAPTPEPGFAR